MNPPLAYWGPAGAVVHQRERAAGDVEAAHRDRLRDGPEVRRRTAAVLALGVDVDGQVGQGAPEVDQGEAVAGAAVGEAAVVDLDLAVDDDVGGRRAEARDLGVVADLDVQGLLGGAVGARFEQERVPAGAHLVVHAGGVGGVDGGLDLGDRRARVEHPDVRAEVLRSRRATGLVERGGRRGAGGGGRGGGGGGEGCRGQGQGEGERRSPSASREGGHDRHRPAYTGELGAEPAVRERSHERCAILTPPGPQFQGGDDFRYFPAPADRPSAPPHTEEGPVRPRQPHEPFESSALTAGA